MNTSTRPFPDVDAIISHLPTVLLRYGVEAVASPWRATLGVDNLNLIVPIQGGLKVVLRAYSRSTSEDIRFELETVGHLHRLGYPVPRMYRQRNGDPLTFIDQWPVVLQEFLDGEHPLAVDPDHWRRVGNWLAGYHHTIAGFRPRAHKQKHEFSALDLEETLRPVFQGLEYADLLDSVHEFRRKRLPKLIAAKGQLPGGVIHSDFRPDNLLIAGTSLCGVLDFDTSYIASFLRDLAETIVIWTMPGDDLDVNAQTFTAIALAYHAVRPLSDTERSALADTVLLACLSDAISYIADRVSMNQPLPQAEGSTMYRRYKRLIASADELVASQFGRRATE